MADEGYSVIFTTAESESDAKTLAKSLVAERLVACAQIVPIKSFYTWEGEVTEASELLLILKTTAEAYNRVQSYLEEHHPYDVPEILQVPITAGFDPYLRWMTENTQAGERAA
jgi:periplasmic divalent cation tolerance protein